jgi:CBS domain-containing protein
MKKVRDFMSRRVVKLRPSDSIFGAARVLAKHRISGAPVLERGRLVGMVSESDIVKFMSMKLSSALDIPKKVVQTSLSLLMLDFMRASRDHLGFKKELKRISKTKVGDIMTQVVTSVEPDANLFDAAARMDRHDINRLPVVDGNGRLVGIIARADLIKALCD